MRHSDMQTMSHRERKVIVRNEWLLSPSSVWCLHPSWQFSASPPVERQISGSWKLAHFPKKKKKVKKTPDVYLFFFITKSKSQSKVTGFSQTSQTEVTTL